MQGLSDGDVRGSGGKENNIITRYLLEPIGFYLSGSIFTKCSLEANRVHRESGATLGR